MDSVKVQPHIQLSSEQTQPVALLVGDPARALQLAQKCQKYTELAYNREYRSFLCEHDGAKFLAVSHGIGTAGAAICFEELIKAGVKCLIRLGTAGSMNPSTLKAGDVVVIEAAVKEDGVTALLVPKGFPAIADISIYNTIMAAGKKLTNTELKHGITLTSDVFYHYEENPGDFNKFGRMKCVDVVEMEISALFVIAKIRGAKAGALVTLDGCPLPEADTYYEPQSGRTAQGKDLMLQIGIQSAVDIVKNQLY